MNFAKTTVFEPVLGAGASAFSSPSTSMPSPPPSAAPEDEVHESAIGYMETSLTEKSRTLKAGLSMAHCSALPLATHSSKLSVLEHSRPKNFASISCTAGMRTLPPKTSTDAISSMGRPQPSKALWMTFCSFSKSGSHMVAKWSRSMTPLTSMSFMKHSTEIGAFAFALSTFFCLSAAVRRRNMALALVYASILCFSSHSLRKWSTSSSLKSRPPSRRSHAVESTLSLPFTNETMLTVVSDAPMSRKTTLVALSAGRSVL